MEHASHRPPALPTLAKAAGPLLWWLPIGCTPGGELVGEPVSIVAAEHAPLSAELSVRTSLPTTLRVALEGDGVDLELAFPGYATEHQVPLHGLRADRDVAVTVQLRAEDGQTWRDTATLRTGALPDDLPHIEVLGVEADQVYDGWILLPLIGRSSRRGWLVAVDPRDGEVAWLYSGPWAVGIAGLTERNTVLGMAGQHVLELDWTGRSLRHFSGASSRNVPDDAIVVDVPAMNHDVREQDGRIAVLSSRRIEVPLFPTSYDAPASLDGPVDIEDGEVVFFSAADGAVLERWPLSERLDTTRIGFDSLNLQEFGYDWVHANAVLPYRGGWLVSTRHQDALISLDGEGDVRWILSNPWGWSERLRPLVLDGPTDWPFHPHGPTEAANGDLLVFDNGNDGYSPYAPPVDEPERSRVLAYTIDDATRTASLAWSWAPPDDLFSNGLGSAEALPSGDVLAAFPLLPRQGDETRGQLGVRVFELAPGAPSGQSVLDLRITSDAATDPLGVNAYRATPVRTFWADDVEVIRR